MKEPRIRVLIVDDSSVIRTMLRKILERDPQLEVVGVAPDPYVAREKLVELKPDVMTLDIEMPRMDGLTFIEKVMQHFPTRTLIISSISERGSETALRALEAGAVDVMQKPAIGVETSLAQMAEEIVARVKTVARARIPAAGPRSPLTSPARLPSLALPRTTHQILAIAASTGGTEALKRVLTRLPADIPGTVIVQHMPPNFTRTFAEALNSICPFEVREAQPGDRVLPGCALLAPGNFHMELTRAGGYYSIVLHQQPLLHGVRPAADYLMKSVAAHAGANATGVVLTGMGRDGAQGLLAMRQAGAFNIAQDEQTCVVFGMPKEAIALGAIDRVVPLDSVADAIVARLRMKAVA